VLLKSGASTRVSPPVHKGLTFEQQKELLLIQRETDNLRLLPPFSESDVDTFFHLFERVAIVHAWMDLEQRLLLQCVLSGKAQQAYSSLSVADSQVYEHV